MSKELKHNSNEENTSNKKSKKPLIITLSIIGGVAVAAGIAAAVWFFGMREPEVPTEKDVLAVIKADKSLTQLKVGKTEYDFEITKADIAKPVEEDETLSFGAIVERECDMYKASNAELTVVYEKKGVNYSYKETQLISQEVTFSPLKGIDPEVARKKVAKVYKKAKFEKQDTNLEKGVDKLYFKVDDDEYEGTAVIAYKFDEKNGWVYKKFSDKNVSFKKGVTHAENGLYTNSNIKNILFLGIDGDDWVGRSDCMMLISVDSNTGKLKQTSFMRDNWFNIPGHGENKLNSAYALGGADLTVKTIQDVFKIKIDNYVAVNFSTFKAVINALGGVDINITDDEAGYINWQLGKNGQTGVGLVSGGNVTLNGQQALWLCRDRGGNGFGGNDFTRSQRQRRVIQSLVKSYKNYTPTKVLATLNALKGNVKTNLSADDFRWFAERSTHFFGYKFAQRGVPEDGEWSAGFTGGGAWIIQLHDFNKLKKDVQQFIYEDLK